MEAVKLADIPGLSGLIAVQTFALTALVPIEKAKRRQLFLWEY